MKIHNTILTVIQFSFYELVHGRNELWISYIFEIFKLLMDGEKKTIVKPTLRNYIRMRSCANRSMM